MLGNNLQADLWVTAGQRSSCIPLQPGPIVTSNIHQHKLQRPKGAVTTSEEWVDSNGLCFQKYILGFSFVIRKTRSIKS
jgi:hypothetical protein